MSTEIDRRLLRSAMTRSTVPWTTIKEIMGAIRKYAAVLSPELPQ